MTNDLKKMQRKFDESTEEVVGLYIMNHVKAGDLVITQDIGLASTLLPKDVYVLSPRGIPFEEKSINSALDMRYLAKARRNGVYGKGPKPFTNEDRIRFRNE
jgi:uncharacterized protein